MTAHDVLEAKLAAAGLYGADAVSPRLLAALAARAAARPNAGARVAARTVAARMGLLRDDLVRVTEGGPDAVLAELLDPAAALDVTDRLRRAADERLIDLLRAAGGAVLDEDVLRALLGDLRERHQDAEVWRVAREELLRLVAHVVADARIVPGADQLHLAAVLRVLAAELRLDVGDVA